MIVFAYREKPYGTDSYDRDAVHYMDTFDGAGSKSTCGPCFIATLSRLSSSSHPNGDVPAYDEVETYLTEEQWDRLAEDGLDYDIIDALESGDNADFAENVFADEIRIMMEEHDISESEAINVISEYGGPYRDHGILGTVYGSWDEAYDEKAWSWGVDEDDEDAMEQLRNAIDNDEDFVELGDGRVAYLMR